MKLEESSLNAAVGNKNVEKRASTSVSSHKQQSVSSSSTNLKNTSRQEQNHSSQVKTESITNMKEIQTSHQNGKVSMSNGSTLKVNHATMESVGQEFHQATSIVQQTGYDGVTLFGSRKSVTNGQPNSVTNGKQAEGCEKVISCPMELPEVKPLAECSLSNGNNILPQERKVENNIASEYFQNKYGSDNTENASKRKLPVVSKQALVNEINSSITAKQASRSSSVGVHAEKSGGTRSRSKTATPERDSRASSISKRANGGDFSYLSLLPDDGSFPHRTHPIGDPQTSRRSSIQHGGTGKLSRAGSTEYLNQTEKKNFMVRSNPIGLAEPSVKRDGYAVGKDGSFYRSSEHLFENKVSQANSRESSEAPEGNWRGKWYPLWNCTMRNFSVIKNFTHYSFLLILKSLSYSSRTTTIIYFIWHRNKSRWRACRT